MYGGDSLDPDGGGIVRRRSAAANSSGVLMSCHRGTPEALGKNAGEPGDAGLAFGEAAFANLLNSLHGVCMNATQQDTAQCHQGCVCMLHADDTANGYLRSTHKQICCKLRPHRCRTSC